MKVCRFKDPNGHVHLGLVQDEKTVLSLSAAGLTDLSDLLGADDVTGRLREPTHRDLPKFLVAAIEWLPPVDRQEIWAAGVTYLRSKTARMQESDFSATAYDRVYDAERPELFFKALPEKAVPTGGAVGIRKDARWNVPEPELALVINAHGRVVGYTIGNDMSSRDIEGENLLYLPQAKVYHRSCALGPWIVIGPDEAEARGWQIQLTIRRKNEAVFQGETSVNQIKRSFSELAGFLCRSQVFAHGAVLLTGTGVVPPESFSLEEGDHVTIYISGIGTLANPVVRV